MSDKPDILIPVPTKISRSYLSDVIINGCEQGIGYWGDFVVFNEASQHTCFVALTKNNNDLFGRCIIEIIERNDERGESGDRWTLDLTNIGQIVAGLTKMQELVPNQFANLIAANDDAITADCLIQATLFGEIRYG